jgi:hypothetical protein
VIDVIMLDVLQMQAGVIVFVVVAFVAVDCMCLLLDTKRSVAAKHGVTRLSYGDVVRVFCS